MGVIEKAEDITKLTKDIISIYINIKESEYDKLIIPNWIECIHIYEYKYELDNLPNSIVKLFLWYYDNKIDNLPLSLKKLHIYSNKFTNSLDYLNEGLEELIISHIVKPRKFLLSNLPFTLLKLKIFCKSEDVYNLSNLPSNLEEITLGCNFIFENLPAKLKKVIIYKDNKELIDNIKKIKNISPNILIKTINYGEDEEDENVDMYGNYIFLC